MKCGSRLSQSVRQQAEETDDPCNFIRRSTLLPSVLVSGDMLEKFEIKKKNRMLLVVDLNLKNKNQEKVF